MSARLQFEPAVPIDLARPARPSGLCALWRPPELVAVPRTDARQFAAQVRHLRALGLTPEALRQLLEDCLGPGGAGRVPGAPQGPPDPVALPPTTPVWDPLCRTLWWGPLLVKRYRRPAPSQELILSSFQEQGWRHRIDDPLIRTADSDHRERLHTAIKCLNRGQLHPVLRFTSNGTGTGICWSLRDEL
jgi:hypothetical protein